MSGFVVYMRSPEASALRKHDPNGYLLLSLIAERARWKAEPCPITGRKHGEALIGDFEDSGLKSRGQYREATKRLTKAGFIAIKTTSKGTVATLTDSRIWSLSPSFTAINSTNEQPSSSHPTTTKEQGNKGEQRTTPPKSLKGEWKPDETQSRLNRLFKRKDSTKWSDKELRAFRKIEFSEEDIATIENYYLADHEDGKDYRRRDIQTLLNNWTGELDRAGNWKPKPTANPDPKFKL
jgi:hypothetical protein